MPKEPKPNIKTTQDNKTENLIENKPDTKPKSQPEGQTDITESAPAYDELPMSLPSISESPKRSNLEKQVEVTYMLLNGMTIRQISAKGYAKSFVEKVSRALNKKGLKTRRGFQGASVAKQKYDSLPYEHEIMRKEPSPWAQQMMRDFMFLDMFSELRGKRSQRNSGGQKLDFNGILMARAVGGGGGNKELLELLASMKQMGLIGETSDPLESFQKYSEIQQSGEDRYKRTQHEANARAEAKQNKTFIQTAVEKGLEVGGKLLNQPRIPKPNPSTGIPNPDVIVAPSSTELLPSQREALSQMGKTPIPELENLKLPNGSLPKIEPIHESPSNLGYNNFSDPFKLKKDKGGK